jgi:hypothetical protein
MNTSTTRITLPACLLAAALAGACADDRHPGMVLNSGDPVRMTHGSGFEHIKALAGTWQTAPSGDMPAMTVTYRVVSNGSAVEEDLFPGSDHEMITMFHEDGGQLMATHYCALKNQPRLVGGMTGPNTVTLGMADITNYHMEPGQYMGRAQYTFDGPDHLTSNWTGYDKNGSPWHEGKFELEA